MEKKLIITEDQLFDYIKCPAFYDMKYNKKIPYKDTVSMQYLLDQVCRKFYTNLLDKKVLNMQDLKKKWDSVCNGNKDYINSKRNLEGINYIVNFARWASENKIILVDYNSYYSISFDDVVVEGTLGAILALPGRKCELLVSKFSTRAPEQFELDKSLKYTLDCYAFRKEYKHNISAVKIVHFKNNKEFTTYRTNNDFERLESTIKGVGNGIRNNSFYPRENVFCGYCYFKEYCKYWIN